MSAPIRPSGQDAQVSCPDCVMRRDKTGGRAHGKGCPRVATCGQFRPFDVPLSAAHPDNDYCVDGWSSKQWVDHMQAEHPGHLASMNAVTP